MNDNVHIYAVPCYVRIFFLRCDITVFKPMNVIVTDGLIIYGNLGHQPSAILAILYCQVGQNHLIVLATVCYLAPCGAGAPLFRFVHLLHLFPFLLFSSPYDL